MTTENWHGRGRASANPWVGVADKDEVFFDQFGREFTVPAGSEMKHFETTNRGWVTWRENGRAHVRDVG